MFFCNFVFFCFLPFFRGVFRTLKTCLKQVQSTVKHCGKNTPPTPPPKTGKKLKLHKSHKIVFLGYFGGGGGGVLNTAQKGSHLRFLGQNDENRHFGLNPHGTPGLSLSSCWEDGRAGEDNLPKNHDVLNRNNKRTYGQKADEPQA